MLYLVTKSQDYYPSFGTGDWQSLHTSEEEAQEAFDAIMRERVAAGSSYEVCLIALSPNGGWITLIQQGAIHMTDSSHDFSLVPDYHIAFHSNIVNAWLTVQLMNAFGPRENTIPGVNAHDALTAMLREYPEVYEPWEGVIHFRVTNADDPSDVSFKTYNGTSVFDSVPEVTA